MTAFQKHKKTIYISGLVLTDSLFFTGTDPSQVPSSLLIVGFLLMVANIYGIARLIVSVLKVYGFDAAKKAPGLVGFMTIIGAIVLALDSTGELTNRDIVVLLPFTAIAYLYLRSVRVRKTS